MFHSVSAFCTAGFGLYNNNLEPFASSIPVNVITSILAISGSLGFIVVTDFWNRLSGKTQSITYTTKVIIGVMIVLLLVGTGVIYYGEPSLNPLSGGLRLMISFFQAMSALTTVGFNTIPLGDLSLGVLLILIFLMYVGA